jgi:hypothetical protein
MPGRGILNPLELSGTVLSRKVAERRKQQVSNNEAAMEMFGPDPTGVEYRMMEIRHTRK